MLLVPFQEVITSLCLINVLRLHIPEELPQHSEENRAHCISLLTGHSVTSSHGLL